MEKKEFISRVLELIKQAMEINETTPFGVDVDYGYVGESFEFRLYKTKSIGDQALMWETIAFDAFGIEETFTIVEDAFNDVIKEGVYTPILEN